MKEHNCKHCEYFGIKEVRGYWCYVPDLQNIKRQDLLDIKDEETLIRYCECFQIKCIYCEVVIKIRISKSGQ